MVYTESHDALSWLYNPNVQQVDLGTSHLQTPALEKLENLHFLTSISIFFYYTESKAREYSAVERTCILTLKTSTWAILLICSSKPTKPVSWPWAQAFFAVLFGGHGVAISRQTDEGTEFHRPADNLQISF